MNRVYLLWGFVILCLVLPVGNAFAQDENSLPLYARYCNPTRLAQGDEAINAVLNDLSPRLNDLEAFLGLMGNGNLTYIEGITQAEQAIADWNASPIQQIPCLAALDNDVTTMLNEILVAMFYGQIVNTEASQTHLQTAQTLLNQIRAESAAAAQYIALPVPTPEPTQAALPTDAPPTTDAASGPNNDQLTQVILDFLRNNGITMVSNGGVQTSEDGWTVNLVLNRQALNGEALDYRNSLWVLDVLAQLLPTWPEIDDLGNIRLETFDGSTRTTVIEADGASFRARYINGEINQADFETSLAVTEETP